MYNIHMIHVHKYDHIVTQASAPYCVHRGSGGGLNFSA